MKSSPAKLLFSRATTIVINATIRNRHSTGFDNNLNNVLALHRKMIGLRKHTCVVNNLIRNVLQLLMEILYTQNSQVIIDTNINLPTLSISEAGYPFQVFVFPYALMLNVLIFLIHRALARSLSSVRGLVGLVGRVGLFGQVWLGGLGGEGGFFLVGEGALGGGDG